ncbi:MAG: hypothetical protein ACK41P_00805 [Asticcacaulis sp.]
MTQNRARLAAQMEEQLAALEALPRPDSSAEILRRTRCVIALARACAVIEGLERDPAAARRIGTKAANTKTAQTSERTVPTPTPAPTLVPLNRQERRRRKAEQARSGNAPKRG